MAYYHKLISLMLLGFLLGCTFLFVLLPERDFSPLENRMLQTKPVPAPADLLSGNFTATFDQYVADQFVFRDWWVSLKVKVERLLQKKEQNGVYFGKDGYLLQVLPQDNEEIWAENLVALDNFAKKSPVPVYFLPVPAAAQVLPEKLPAFAAPSPSYLEPGNFRSKLKHTAGIDVFNEFYGQEKYYYRTDHHWTTEGAYAAYRKTGEAVGFTPVARESFKIETVAADFLGSLAARTGTQPQPDVLQLFLPQTPLPCRVEYVAEKRIEASFYAWEHIDSRDKYAVFLDGNHALIKITTSVPKGRRLLVVKDSFANAMLPFLAHHYEEIYVVDLRFFHDNLAVFLWQQEVDEVLFLYGTMTLATETVLRKLAI
ncbi:MAG: hypothetical protein GX357_01705 [Firmicutes bacterium]|nr:hypothetical protein [Bacillota bacterium]